MMRLTMISTAAALALLGAAAAEADSGLVLLRDGRIVPIDTDRLAATGPAMRPTGGDGKIVAFDRRPKDGRVYALSERGTLHRLDPATGELGRVAALSRPVAATDGTVLDFNPVADRIRLIDPTGANYRINPDTGEVVVDGRIAYDPAVGAADRRPVLVAGAYVDSVPGAKETALYTVDAGARTLNLQAPPNDGVQKPRGPLGIAVGSATALDIASDPAGGNRAWLLVGSDLYRLDTGTGAASRLGRVARLPGEVADLVILPGAG